MNSRVPEYRIQVSQLRPGVFIRLEKTSWFEHPFLFSSFKIKDDEQIALLHKLGVREVICIPEKSDVLPLRPDENRKPRQNRSRNSARKPSTICGKSKRNGLAACAQKNSTLQNARNASPSASRHSTTSLKICWAEISPQSRTRSHS